MPRLKHELWSEGDQAEWTFCLAGPMGDEARRFLKPGARMVWTVEAENHCEAMTKYYEHMGYGMYRPQRESDCDPYPSEWLTIQASDKKKA